MSLMNSSTILDEAVGRVKSRILIDGIYTCNASNQFGTDSKTFYVSVNGKIIALVAMKNEFRGQNAISCTIVMRDERKRWQCFRK